MGYSSWHIYRQAKEQVQALAENNLRIYEQDIYVRLSKTRNDLLEVTNEAINSYTDEMQYLDKYFADHEIFELMGYKLSTNTDCGYLFVKEPSRGILVRNCSTKLPAEDKSALEKLIVEGNYRTKGVLEESWDIKMVNGRAYIYTCFLVDGFEAGVYAKLDNMMNLMKPIVNREVEESFIIREQEKDVLTLGSLEADDIVMEDGEPSAKKSGWLEAKLPVRNTDLTIFYFRKDESYVGYFGSTIFYLATAGILCVVMSFALYHIVRKKIIRPIRELEKGAGKIEGGDYSYRVPEEEGSTEFNRLSRNFNSMTSEIVNLRIRDYEQKLQMKDREVRLLLAQVRPHFYLNAMTTIQSMSWQERNEDIRRYIDALSMHIRYVLQENVQDVELYRELEHVDNYLKMQEIKLPDSIFWMIECPEELREVKIPHLMIHTVIENIFKHADTQDDILNVLIQCTSVKSEQFYGVSILIEDNGKGFEQEMLEKYNGGKEIREDSQIGLSNIYRTLEILYDRTDLLHISNAFPHGARVEIKIPVMETA